MELSGNLLHRVDDQFGYTPLERITNKQKRRSVHRCLGEQHCLLCHVNCCQCLVYRLDHNALIVHNAAHTEHFGMIILSEDHNLIALIPEFADTLLKLCHDGTCRIDYLDAMLPCCSVR